MKCTLSKDQGKHETSINCGAENVQPVDRQARTCLLYTSNDTFKDTSKVDLAKTTAFIDTENRWVQLAKKKMCIRDRKY